MTYLHHDINPNYSSRPHLHGGFIAHNQHVLGDRWGRPPHSPIAELPLSEVFSFVHILPFASCGLGCPSSVLHHRSHFLCSRLGKTSYVKEGIGGPHWLCLYKIIVFSQLIPLHKWVLIPVPLSPPPLGPSLRLLNLTCSASHGLFFSSSYPLLLKHTITIIFTSEF